MFCIIVFYLFQSFVYAEKKDVKALTEPTIKWSNLESVTKGEHLKVILVAYEYFSKEVNANIAKIEENLDSNSFRAYMTKLENYDIYVSKGNNKYRVQFVLRTNEKYPMFLGDGGIDEYEVDSKTYQVTEILKGK